MNHTSLVEYFQSMYYMKKRGFAIQETEELPIFERDIYLKMFVEGSLAQ